MRGRPSGGGGAGAVRGWRVGRMCIERAWRPARAWPGGRRCHTEPAESRARGAPVAPSLRPCGGQARSIYVRRTSYDYSTMTYSISRVTSYCELAAAATTVLLYYSFQFLLLYIYAS